MKKRLDDLKVALGERDLAAQAKQRAHDTCSGAVRNPLITLVAGLAVAIALSSSEGIRKAQGAAVELVALSDHLREIVTQFRI
ncbi:MAG: hypothetical protein QG608_3607 [Actinomycetota bacterium]|nr:hypothetical protein [Actinomycetota bacterium]